MTKAQIVIQPPFSPTFTRKYVSKQIITTYGMKIYRWVFFYLIGWADFCRFLLLKKTIENRIYKNRGNFC